jgi:hypothetical protein
MIDPGRKFAVLRLLVRLLRLVRLERELGPERRPKLI